ncbi:MAG: TonB family protein [Flavobacteriales bacterium]|nr:TonB family protein [Flavobacteriales bacterium]
MNEFLRFLLISNVSLLVIWLNYRLILSGNTFHGLNRVYMLGGSVLSLLIPFLPVGRTTSEKFIGIELPVVEVGSGVVPTEMLSLPINMYAMFYTMGVLVALWFFVRSVSSLIQLVKQSESEIVMGELVLRSDKAGPFSFLSIIHLPIKLTAGSLETILKHELAHVRLGHSYDVLWLSFLRILFWFNPLLTYYLRSLQEIHEYQADALTHISSTKEHYVKVQLDQLFQLPSELSFANSFYNSINLKKRVNMIYSERTSKWGAMRYLVAVPLIATIGLLAACTETPADAVQTEVEQVLKQAEVMPEYPGGMQALMTYMGSSIKYPETAEADGLEGKVFVQFVVDKSGKVGQVEVVKSVRDDLDAEAIRVISEMPDWTPGKQGGKAVNVQLVLPISYKLS